MMAVPAVDAAFNNSLNWALFVVVSVIEPSAGAAIYKGLQRLAGTLLAGCLGVATQYLVYLLNGLSYQNGGWLAGMRFDGAPGYPSSVLPR